ncbi:MAG: UDP-N-acetylmuramoyl-L-alanine--D-glutamate ligase [Bacteroidota bacterium]
MGKVIVLGAGESGVGAAALAKKLGHEVLVSDAGQVKSQYKEKLTELNIPFEEGGHTKESFFDAEIVIKSPGIPPWVPLIEELVAADIPVISEIEFAYRYAEAPIIAITGSNGKTTTTSLIHHLLKGAGINAYVGGNIGESFAMQVASLPMPEVFVLEVSSFQLDDCVDFQPNIALLLNITPDHLDRYQGSMEAYTHSKYRITMNQSADDVFIFNEEDKWSIWGKENNAVKAQQLSFGLEKGKNALRLEGQLKLMNGEMIDLKELKILGPHNHLNVMAALLAVQAFGLRIEEVKEALYSFLPIAHRLEPIGNMKGVEWVNDSKATNVDAVKYALEAMDKPVIWLAGGVDKGNDYTGLLQLVADKVKSIIILGENDEKIRQNFHRPISNVASMQEAVRLAQQQAEKGDIVLLSPACSSFDLFRNYIDRGEQFREAVLALA